MTEERECNHCSCYNKFGDRCHDCGEDPPDGASEF